MSASPANAPSGPNSTTPSGGPLPPLVRKRAPVSIFANNKRKPFRKPAPAQAQKPTAPGTAQNGVQHAQQANGTPSVAHPPEPIEDKSTYEEYPIIVSRSALQQGLHYHAAKLWSKNNTIANPYDPNQFQRPLKLHRRMARDKMLEMAEQSDAASGVDDKERELMNIKRAERQAEREANQALIAPTGGDSKKAARKKPKKKVEDVYYDENNPRHRERAQLRYEEARPWHLEDFEGKNVWVGSYEEPMSNSSVMFEINSDGFRMVPVEKHYKFTQTNRFTVMDSDAVEKHMGQKFKAPRWFMGTQQANDEARRQAALMKREHMRANARIKEEDDEQDPFANREEYHADVDEIDFEFGEEFQDDDEGMIFGEQDEEARDIEKRIREEMRSANLPSTGLKNEDKDWDDEERREREKEKEAKRKAKRMRRLVVKKERKNEYDSDSETNEFSEEDTSEDSEEERERLEQERKEEEARKQNGDKSGASTKGTNTPSGRPEKRDQGKLGLSLKRPGSPDLSEMSGNESSRKKAKGLNGRAVSSAPNGARSLSPDTAKPKRGPSGYNSGSDTDTSRTGGRPKIRLRASPPGSPADGASRTNSRAGSPAPARAALSFPTEQEVRAAIPPSGIGIKELVAKFRPRLGEDTKPFIVLVKRVGRQDPGRKGVIIQKEGDRSAAAGPATGAT